MTAPGYAVRLDNEAILYSRALLADETRNEAWFGGESASPKIEPLAGIPAALTEGWLGGQKHHAAFTDGANLAGQPWSLDWHGPVSHHAAMNMVAFLDAVHLQVQGHPRRAFDVRAPQRHVARQRRPFGTHAAQVRVVGPRRDEYEERLAFLRQEAQDEGIGLRAASRQDFESLVSGAPKVRRAELVLLDNGNLRAFWEDPEDTAQLGLQFLGEGEVQYVLLRREPGSEWLPHAVGQMPLTGLEHWLTEYDLRSLAYE